MSKKQSARRVLFRFVGTNRVDVEYAPMKASGGASYRHTKPKLKRNLPTALKPPQMSIRVVPPSDAHKNKLHEEKVMSVGREVSDTVLRYGPDGFPTKAQDGPAIDCKN